MPRETRPDERRRPASTRAGPRLPIARRPPADRRGRHPAGRASASPRSAWSRDDGRLEVMAVAGNDEAREQLEGTCTPIDRLLEELEQGRRLGPAPVRPPRAPRLRRRRDLGLGARHRADRRRPGRLAPAGPADRPAVRRPAASCAARLAIDLPVDGRRPGEAQRAVLNRYAEQAGRAVVIAARARGPRRAGADGRGRPPDRPPARPPSSASSGSSPRASDALIEGFRAAGMWIQTFDDDGDGTGARSTPPTAPRSSCPTTSSTIAERAAAVPGEPSRSWSSRPDAPVRAR